MTEPHQPHHTPHTWHEVDEESVRFQALLRQYGNYQEATDAYRRGEEPDPKYRGGSANPM